MAPPTYQLSLPRSSEGFVGGSGDKVCMFKGRRDGFGCHQAADVGHVGKHVGLNVSTQLREQNIQETNTGLGFKYNQYGKTCSSVKELQFLSCWLYAQLTKKVT